MTRAFANRCSALPVGEDALVPHTEDCEGIGPVEVLVKNYEEQQLTPVKLNWFQKLKRMATLSRYTAPRMILGKAFPGGKREYRNLPT